MSQESMAIIYAEDLIKMGVCPFCNNEYFYSDKMPVPILGTWMNALTCSSCYSMFPIKDKELASQFSEVGIYKLSHKEEQDDMDS